MSGTAFVVLPSQSKHGVIFGKNAARPDGDVMEVVFVPAGESSGDIQVSTSVKLDIKFKINIFLLR